MRKLLSLPLSCCLCWIAVLILGVMPAGAGHKVCLCHIPPGNPDEAHMICVGAPAVRAHFAHGDSLGACPVVCGGSAGDTCGAGEFCKRDAGLCSADDQGVCTPVPSTCPITLDPVCGCDGKTYDNTCVADAAGVGVQHMGVCACGGSSGISCDESQFCKRDAGECTAGAEGVCAPIPVTCPALLDPVCGCDGVTYSNACYADVAEIPVQHPGACEPGPPCGGSGGGTCNEGQFCKPPQGVCAPDAAGVCANLPPVCSPLVLPVCGCDGTTYSNACMADAAGVGVDHAGECAFCGGITGAICGTGEFCKFADGTCGLPDNQGFCQETPVSCPAVLDPVCGCNGTTFSNACIAEGVPLDHEGPCVPLQICGGPAGVTCPEGEFCKGREGACGAEAEGVCTVVPRQCPVRQLTVCGCDGMTYYNVCFADAARVTVDHFGRCLTLK
jgi:Kazal-type serine protease inhibitor-like protein